MLRLLLLVSIATLGATAQVQPISNGSCRVNASGLTACDWMSAYTSPAATKTTSSVAEKRPKPLVTRFVLSPGAPLNSLVEGSEVLIVGMNSGEVVNEKNSPLSHVNVSNGSVMLMPKGEPYLLRNVGGQTLELLVIEVRQ